MTIFDIIQIISGILAISAFIPQIVKTIKTKSVGDMSLPMFITNFTAACLAEIYGFHLWKEQDEPAFLITNSMVMLGAGTILFLLLRYRKRD
jgi:MtN3 and saliva related transmembrane protein